MGKTRRKAYTTRKNGKAGRIFPIKRNEQPDYEDGDMLAYLNELKEQATSKNLPVITATQTAPQEECWESGIEVIRSCGTAPQSLPVTIGPLAKAKMDVLMQLFPRIEWLAYLVGTVEGNVRTVTDLVIPKQEVTSVRVDVAPEGVNVPTIGVIHSHHGMGNGFSGTDHAYINQNHDISLCISHGGIAGQVRTSTACGKYVIVAAKVFYQVEGFDAPAFVTEVKEKVKEKAYAFGPNYYQNKAGFGVDILDRDKGTGASNGVGGVNVSSEYSLLELTKTFVEDLEEDPEKYDLIDLVAVKEIVSVVLAPRGTYEVFKSLYESLLDNNTFGVSEAGDDVSVLDFVDELDSSFDVNTNSIKLSNQEKTELIRLFKTLGNAIDVINIVELEETEKDILGGTAETVFPPTLEEAWDAEDANKSMTQ